MSWQTQVNMTAVQAGLKEMYVGQNLVELGYKNRPFYAMVEKNTELDGVGFPLPIKYSNGTTSALFANALANIAAPGITRFLLTSMSRYSLGQLDRKTMAASAKSTASFIKAVEVAVTGAVESVSEALSCDCYGDGTGQRSTIGTITTGVIVLPNPGDIVGFPLNQKLNAINSGSVRGASGWVVARNAQAGTITVSTSLGGAAGTPASWTAGDGLCLDGDYNAVLSGLQAWLPGSVQSNDSFFTCNRSADSRLWGVSYNPSATTTIEETLQDGVSILQREGGRPDAIFTGPASYTGLAKSLQSRGVYVMESKKVGDISFPGIVLQTAVGPLPVYQDPFCPAKAAFALQMDTWGLYSTGPTVEVQSDMGAEGNLLRVYNQDAGEVRVSSYPQLGCNAPGNNGKITLPV